jgi:hypothetical protein
MLQLLRNNLAASADVGIDTQLISLRLPKPLSRILCLAITEILDRLSERVWDGV